MLSEEEKKVINSLENEYKKVEEEGNILFPLYKQQAKTVLNLITKLQKENEEKDKQIDLMAEYISKIDIEEDVCMKNKTNPEWCNEDYTNCKNCIKQNFKKLAKEKGE